MSAPEHTRRARRRRSVRAAIAGAAAAAALAATTVACGTTEESLPSIGYAVDNTVTTYNANTVDGATSGARQALARVLPGFGYVDPAGQVISDTDIGAATVVSQDPLTVQYRLSPDSVYSDGVPMSCDDLVLAWAAASGRFTAPDASGAPANLFSAARRSGYVDIERIDCQTGSKDATVVFRAGRAYADWRALFGATELMPAHVAARVSGVPDVVAAIGGGDVEALRRLADFWNTGWNLTPGRLDLSLLPASGPYRIESFTAEDGLVLVANERWWGNKPGTDRIVVWPRGTDASAAAADGRVHVADTGTGALDLSLGDDVETTAAASRNVEQLVLGTGGGSLGAAAARRAFALCVPRSQLFDEFGRVGDVPATGLGSGTTSSRLLPADSPLYPGVSGPAARYDRADTTAAEAELAAAGTDRITVRIGYLGPDPRRARTVELIAQSCREAGIEVVDAASDTFTPSQLTAGQVDAVLAGTAVAAGAGGTADMQDARGALNSAAGSNVGRFADARVDQILDALAVTTDDATISGLVGEAETILWTAMPTLPLYAQPRETTFAGGLRAAVANPSAAGAGWNMDRWILNR